MRVAAAAVAVVGLVALPTGAQASLIGDTITLEVTVCTLIPADCTDTVQVVDPTAEFTSTPNNPPTGIGTNLLSAFGTNSFININDSTVDFFFDFGIFVSQFIFTGLEWQDADATGLAPTFNVTSGTLGSNPSFTNVTASTFTVSVDCISVGQTCSTSGAGLTVNLNPVHVSAVPLPAALPLFLSALAGLGLMGWRRRQAGA